MPGLGEAGTPNFYDLDHLISNAAILLAAAVSSFIFQKIWVIRNLIIYSLSVVLLSLTLFSLVIGVYSFLLIPAVLYFAKEQFIAGLAILIILELLIRTLASRDQINQ